MKKHAHKKKKIGMKYTHSSSYPVPPLTKSSGRKIIFMPPTSMSDVASPTDMIMSWMPVFQSGDPEEL